MLWFEGRLVEGATVPFDLSDRGLTLGDGVFDTALCLGGRIAFEAEHVTRLVAAAAHLGFAVPRPTVETAMRALAAACPQAAIRTTLTRGTGPRGLAPPPDARPALWASAAPLRPGMAFAPLSLLPVETRRNETSVCSRLKTLGYLDAVLAARDAAQAGFDEALFLNTRGAVACAGTGNLFALKGECLVTPPLRDGALDGIMRSRILLHAAECGLRVEETAQPLSAYADADAVVLTNSLRLIAPVSAIGIWNIPSVDHPVVARLTQAVRRDVTGACGVSGIP
ncbi:aminotransferase class IV [Methylobacterium sp. Leaf108]|uniref:aminotransferase class IV n=1 Tax=Methylobacterium sp. Leaf108 TaxID=1736256 RepID=UPI0006FD52A9|nr:aminotransferase class IV [Methylobacterium sp. Leaf108]KQP49009.1 class IV aminotransferase [Methylobacterium sp. Leaf108]